MRQWFGMLGIATALLVQRALPAHATTTRPAPVEGDRDKDGVLDAADSCPSEAGSEEFFGCVTMPMAAIVDGKIEIVDALRFGVRSATLERESYLLLDAVAALLADHPEIRRLAIESHTDDLKTPGSSLALTWQRAAAIRNYLIERGVAGERLTALGYGSNKPIADNKTAAGRLANDRIELRIAGK